MKTKELYDMLDGEFSKFEVETRVSRFYSGDNNIVIATVSHDAHTHEDIAHVMRQHGWALYDVGGNGEYHMFTFKRQKS